MAISSDYNQHDQSTVMAWVKLNSLPATSASIVIGPRYGAAGWFHISVDSTGLLTASDHSQTLTGPQLATDTWYHIALATDWAQGTMWGQSRLYVDGVNADTINGASFPINSGTLYWGGETNYWDSGSSPINGVIDDARWFDTAITEQEVQTYMNLTIRPPKNRFMKHQNGTWVRMNTRSIITPPPVDGLMGWQLDSSNTGLARHGITGKNLPVYQGSSSPPAGTKIYGKRILTALDLSAGDIVVEKCLIEPVSALSMSFLITTIGGEQDKAPAILPILRDCTISGDMMPTGPDPNRPEDGDGYYPAMACGVYGLCNIYNCQIFNVGSGIATIGGNRQSDCEVIGNYVHSLRSWGPGATYGNHCDGYTVRTFRVDENPTRSLTVSKNRFDATTANETGAFFIQPINGHIGNVMIEDNYLEGNNWNLYAENHSGNSYSNIRVIDNRFRNDSSKWYAAPSGPGWTEFTENYTFHPSNPDNKGVQLSA